MIAFKRHLFKGYRGNAYESLIFQVKQGEYPSQRGKWEARSKLRDVLINYTSKYK